MPDNVINFEKDKPKLTHIWGLSKNDELFFWIQIEQGLDKILTLPIENET
jgi:hypothetical protein